MTHLKMAATEEVVVGSRFQTEEGDFGTVRFIGSISSTKGEWIGVEWDDPSRGKHSGEHEGVQYFKCKNPTGGSFLRRKKMQFGMSFLSALHQRYIHQDEAVDGLDGVEDMIIQGIQVEILNKKELLEEQSQLDGLKVVTLRDTSINGPGKDPLVESVPNLEDLNLSTNPLLCSIGDVLKIASQLPKLRKLDISENVQMTFDEDSPTPVGHLLSLYINKMQLEIESLEVVLRSLPNLRELFACYNCLSGLHRLNVALMENITVLYIDGNGLSKWSDVMVLSTLPRLETLSLNDNNLTDVTFEPKEKREPFASLKALSLYRNKILGWSALNQINTLPSLVDLRFKQNPLLEGDIPYNARQLVIARVGTITMLNGSQVPVSERQVAQKYYLKRYSSGWLSSRSAEDSRAAFDLEHPRYNHLVEVHGPPDEALLLTKKGTALKDKLVSVTLRVAGDTDGRELTKKLPRDMTVQKLKGLIQRFLKIDFPDQMLSYNSQKTGDEYQLEDDLKDIGFYAVQNGDVILIHRV